MQKLYTFCTAAAAGIAVHVAFYIPAVYLLWYLPLATAAVFGIPLYFSERYNDRAMARPKSIPTTGLGSRVAHLEAELTRVTRLSFEKIDAFYLKALPDAVVYILKHKTQPIYLSLAQLEAQLLYDFTTFYEGDVTLTTGPSLREVMSSPRPAEDLQQRFDTSSYEQLFAEHEKALRFLSDRGLRERCFSPEEIRQQVLQGERRSSAYKRSFAFWPLRQLYWLIRSQGEKYQKPIQEQVQLGTVSLPGLEPIGGEAVSPSSTQAGIQDTIGTPPMPSAPLTIPSSANISAALHPEHVFRYKGTARWMSSASLLMILGMEVRSYLVCPPEVFWHNLWTFPLLFIPMLIGCLYTQRFRYIVSDQGIFQDFWKRKRIAGWDQIVDVPTLSAVAIVLVVTGGKKVSIPTSLLERSIELQDTIKAHVDPELFHAPPPSLPQSFLLFLDLAQPPTKVLYVAGAIATAGAVWGEWLAVIVGLAVGAIASVGLLYSWKREIRTGSTNLLMPLFMIGFLIGSMNVLLLCVERAPGWPTLVGALVVYLAAVHIPPALVMLKTRDGIIEEFTRKYGPLPPARLQPTT